MNSKLPSYRIFFVDVLAVIFVLAMIVYATYIVSPFDFFKRMRRDAVLL